MLSTFSIFKFSKSSKNYMMRQLINHLSYEGWVINNSPKQHQTLFADLMASFNGVNIFVKLSTARNPLKITDVLDLSSSLILHDTHAVFVAGEQVDPQVRARAHDRNCVLITMSEIIDLKQRISALQPKLFGSVDRLHMSGAALGWAKLSNGAGKVCVEVCSNEQVIGT